jgi:hypothetical protein
MDAMHCQKETLKAIRAKDAHYLVAVKDNQPKLFGLLHDLFIEYGEWDQHRIREALRIITLIQMHSPDDQTMIESARNYARDICARPLRDMGL